MTVGLHPRNDSWTECEVLELQLLFERGMIDEEIAVKLRRTANAVCANRLKLGLLRQEQRPPGFPEGVIVDPQDAYLADRVWWLSAQGYPVCTTTDVERSAGFRSTDLLHRLIMRPPSGFVIDHINRDKRDNRRINMRIVTQAVNCQNVSVNANSRSGYRGVSWHEPSKRWRVIITLAGKTKYIGCSKDKDKAHEVARAWRLQNMPGAVD